MWDFSHKEPETISTFRVKDEGIITATFESGTLSDLDGLIAELNMSIRYPGGMVDFFMEQMREGGYVNLAAMRRIKLDQNPKNQNNESA